MRDKGCMNSSIAYYLTVIGGLNWGLVGLGYFLGTNLNIVNLLLGSWPVVEFAVYILVGLATIMLLVGCKCAKCKGVCMACEAGMKSEGEMKM